MVILVGYVTVDMLAPAPDSPKLRRQHAAATILKTLQAKTSGIPETAGEAGGAAEEVEEAPKVEKKRLPLYLHPGRLVLSSRKVSVQVARAGPIDPLWRGSCTGHPPRLGVQTRLKWLETHGNGVKCEPQGLC